MKGESEVNGKLVYWILSVVVAAVGTLCTMLLADIKEEMRETKDEVRLLREEVSSLDVLENRVLRLERIVDEQPGAGSR